VSLEALEELPEPPEELPPTPELLVVASAPELLVEPRLASELLPPESPSMPDEDPFDPPQAAVAQTTSQAAPTPWSQVMGIRS
jgi:hypothetical protein